MRREFVFGLIIGAIVVSIILLTGCEESSNPAPGTTKIEIKTGTDDGGVVALTDILLKVYLVRLMVVEINHSW